MHPDPLAGSVSFSRFSDAELMRRYKILTFTCLIGIILSIAAFVHMITVNQAQQKQEFVFDARTRMIHFSDKWNEIQAFTQLTQRFYLASNQVDEQEFETFVSPMLENDFTALYMLNPHQDYAVLATVRDSAVQITDSWLEDSRVQDALSSAQKSNRSKILFNLEGIPGLAVVVIPLQTAGGESAMAAALLNVSQFMQPVLQNYSGRLSIEDLLHDEMITLFQPEASYVPTQGPSSGMDMFSAYNHAEVVSILGHPVKVVFSPGLSYRAGAIGGNAWAALLIGLLLTAGVGIFYFVLISRNTRISLYADSLAQSQQRLELYSRALAHDLKEPIRTISSFGELLSTESGLSDKSRSYLRYIMDASTHMQRLLESVGKYTHLQASEVPQKEVIMLSDKLQAAKINLHQLIQERQAVISCDALPQLQAHASQMVQLFQNLIANAIRYCPEDRHPEVRVSAEQQGEHWVLCVQDNGSGIPEEYMENIFAPFKRLVGKDMPGSGLGLAISRKIVQLHGGRLWCENVSGRSGAIFYFTLPATPEDTLETISVSEPVQTTKDIPAADTPSTSVPETPHPITPPAVNENLAHILLVDDNPADIQLFRLLFLKRHKLELNLHTAANGRQALDWLKHKDNPAVDLILLDINMPGINGFEVMETMQKFAALAEIPICFLSTSNDEGDREKAFAMGAAGYMTKPADMKQFENILAVISALTLSTQGSRKQLVRTAS